MEHCGLPHGAVVRPASPNRRDGARVTTAAPQTSTLQGALDDAFAGIAARLQAFKPQLVPREVGTLASVATGIARVHGLPPVGFEELLEVSRGLSGLAFNLEAAGVDVVLLGDHAHLQAGQAVRRTGRVMDVAVGDALLGRVIDPLGRPLDRKSTRLN